MATVLQIPFGQRSDGRLVEVSQVERGLKCNCRCPACGEQLLAKKGEVNVQHFSHRSGSDCATGAETALHMAAKQLVADKGWIALPSLEVRVTRTDPECGLFEARRFFGRNKTWQFDRVGLEVSVGKVRPDAIGYIGDAGHGVEIRVTHVVDTDKQAYLGRLMLPSIEVDLAALVGKVFTFDALEAAVITSVENKRWLFHPQQATWEAQLLAGFEDWRRGRRADLARVKERPARPPAPRAEPADVFRAANEKYRALTSREKWVRLERELGIARKDFPSHLRVAPREGAEVVMADKELWQGAVFAKFILGAGNEDRLMKRMPSDGVLSVWLAQRFGVKGGEAAARPVVRSYLNHLRACGFLSMQGSALCVVHNQLEPPARRLPASPPPPRETCTPSIHWRDTWPDDERLRQWATEASKSGSGFVADRFVGWLLRLDAPPTLDEVQNAFFEAKGNPQEVMTVLRSMGVVASTLRYFSYGEPAPWSAG